MCYNRPMQADSDASGTLGFARALFSREREPSQPSLPLLHLPALVVSTGHVLRVPLFYTQH